MAEEAKKEKKNKKSPEGSKKPYLFAVGRRREAVARVRLYDHSVQIAGQEYKKGDVIVNNKLVSEYFRFLAYKTEYNRIFRDTDSDGKFVFSVRVRGGGLSGQLDAVVFGIARVLQKYDKEKYRPVLKAKGYLTRDARIRERRKVGMGGKSRRKKQSPKR